MQKSMPSIKPIIYLLLALLAIGLGVEQFDTERSIYWPGYISMMVFYGVIFYIGLYASHVRKSTNSDEVILAGRSIPLGIAVFTMSATWVGGGYINGAAEFTYSDGLAWVQAPWGYALSLILGGIFFAKKMRRLEFTTVIDPLEERYGNKMAAILSVPAMLGELFWTAAILTALGTTFGTVLGLDFTPSILISAAVAIAYTSVGGLWAVAFTDVIQLIFIFIGLGLVVPYALQHVGGLENVWEVYQQHKGTFSNLIPPLDGWQHPKWGNSYWYWWDSALLLALGGIPWQVYFQRVLSSKDPKTAQRLSIVAGFVCLAAAVPAVIIGMIGDVVTWQEVGVAAPDEAALVLPYVVRYMTPPVVATIGLGAIAAAVMSSVDSSILSASSMASWNVYRRLINPDISAENLHKLLKRVIWIIGIAATLIALQIKSVYVLWYLCSDLIYTILFPQLVTALFDKKANFYGSVAGLVVSGILRLGAGEPALGLPRLIDYPMVTNGTVMFPFRTLAMVSGLITIMVVSRLTQKQAPPKSLEKQTAEDKVTSND